MEGDYVDDDCNFDCESNIIRTVVLVGRTGNGTSATGNSILGEKIFKSKIASCGVVSLCEMHTTKLSHGPIVNVIDTPGLFDNSVGSEFVGEEIVKCIDLAKDGIDAILVVFSVRTRFTDEEVTAIERLKTLFGSKFVEYMIVVFTGGDDLEDNDQTLEDYLGSECPKFLKEALALCENRCVLFDNKTKDVKKQYEQVQQLLSLVDIVNLHNDGKPYTNELFQELKKEAMQNQQSDTDLKMQMQLADEENLQQIVVKVETELRETTTQLQKQLAEEKAARLKIEEGSMRAERSSNNEIRKLKEQLEKAREKHLRSVFRCTIL